MAPGLAKIAEGFDRISKILPWLITDVPAGYVMTAGYNRTLFCPQAEEWWFPSNVPPFCGLFQISNSATKFARGAVSGQTSSVWGTFRRTPGGIGSLDNYQAAGAYQRTVAGARLQYIANFPSVPRFPARPIPRIRYNPFVPPLTAMPAPLPIPYNALPKQKPVEAPELPDERRKVGPPPTPSNDNDPRPRQKPPRTIFVPRKPPGKGTKEKKIRAPKWMSDILGQLTEGIDLFEVLYDSLGRKRSIRLYGPEASYDKWGVREVVLPDGHVMKLPRNPPPNVKAALLYRYFDQIDPGDFAQNFLEEWVLDQIVGRVSGKNPNVTTQPRVNYGDDYLDIELGDFFD